MDFLQLNHTALLTLRNQYCFGNPTVSALVNTLIEQANAELQKKPYTVTDKTHSAPGGDFRDYTSIGPYWWPNPDKPDGRPYIRRDGYINPDFYNSSRFDRCRLEELSETLQTLSATYFYTGNQVYRTKASDFIHTWFLEERTRMNPHLQYAQCIPGICDGRDIGIIDTYYLIDILDSILLVEFEDMAGIRMWVSDYLDWLLTSKNGKGEDSQHNNHGLWYDAQVLQYALFCGREDIIPHRIESITKKRLDAQIAPDGSLPEELARTRSFLYSVFAARAIILTAKAAEKRGLDLWQYKTGNGSGIRDIFDFMLPYFEKTKNWTWQQLDPIQYGNWVNIFGFAYEVYDDETYRDIVEKIWQEHPEYAIVKLLPATVGLTFTR